MFPFRAFRFLAPLIREQRPIFAIGVVLILLTSLSQVAVPRLVGLAIQKLESGIGVDLIGPIALAMVGAVLILSDIFLDPGNGDRLQPPHREEAPRPTL